MKAILIINIPDDDKNIENYYVDYTLTYESKKHQRKKIHWDMLCPLHLIPEKFKLDRGYEKFEKYEKFSELKAYAEGWNDCLDEIFEGK